MLFEPIGCAFSCKGIDCSLLLGYEVVCLCWAKFRCVSYFVKISNHILTLKQPSLFTNSLCARILAVFLGFCKALINRLLYVRR